ncbi:MAG: SLC13 family permease [Chloroflexota bacterium]|nr:SLC13 family permease [Chloroflexota bacterium]
MLGDFTAQQLSFFAILVVAFGLLLTERLRNDLVAVLIILSLYVTGVLQAEEALAGFSSEPAIIVAAIFVLSAGLHQTGLSETIGGWIGRLAGSGYNRALAVIMPAVALLSAFTHHLTTTAVMLPVTLNLSRERDIPPSKLLMPLSFAASLGTTITIIGAPAFLIASSTLQRAGRPGLGIFSIAPIGLSISVVGTLFMLLAGRWLLPERRGSEDPTARFRLDDYFTELTILPDSPFLGQTLEEVHADGHSHFNVVGWLRDGRQLRRPFGERRVRVGDVLLVRTTPEEIVAIREEPGVELHPISKYGAETPRQNGEEEDLADQLVQVVVAPNSDFVGRTIGEIDFRQRYGVVVLSLWRRQGWLEQEMSRIKLREGDVLVLEGNEEALARVQNDRQFLMMVPFQGERRLRRKARLAGAIMLLTIIAAAFNLLSIEMAALAGAVAMVLTRCITGRQAYRAIDARIYVFIAGAIPLGAGMQKSGAAELLASWLQGAIGGWNQMLILFAIFAVWLS